jgi:hypothetical protein
MHVIKAIDQIQYRYLSVSFKSPCLCLLASWHVVKSEKTVREMSNQLDFDTCDELVSQRHMLYHLYLPRQLYDYCQWIHKDSRCLHFDVVYAFH